MRSTTELHPLCGRRASRVAPQYIWWHGLSKLSKKKRVLPTARLELAIFGLGDRRRIHWATRAGVGCLWQEQHPVLLYPILKESMQGQRSPDQKPKLLPWKSSCWLQAKRRQIQKQNKKKMYRAWQDSNLQSSDPKSDALSIRPHTLSSIGTGQVPRNLAPRVLRPRLLHCPGGKLRVLRPSLQQFQSLGFFLFFLFNFLSRQVNVCTLKNKVARAKKKSWAFFSFWQKNDKKPKKRVFFLYL